MARSGNQIRLDQESVPEQYLNRFLDGFSRAGRCAIFLVAAALRGICGDSFLNFSVDYRIFSFLYLHLTPGAFFSRNLAAFRLLILD